MSTQSNDAAVASLQVEVKHIAQNTERLAVSVEKIVEKLEQRITALESRQWRIVIQCILAGSAGGTGAAAAAAKVLGVM